jgi:hypothetical protein
MPAPALAHLAKKRHISIDRAEHLWHKAKGIVSKEYGGQKTNKGYWPLVMGITKKMMGMNEDLTEDEVAMAHAEPMSNLLTQLMVARNVAHMWHWKVKSFALHMALGELYEGLTEMMDELAEMHMGAHGQDSFHVDISRPNGFSEQDPLEFVAQLHAFLHDVHDKIPQDGFIVNKFEELQAMVAKVKYKVENLK